MAEQALMWNERSSAGLLVCLSPRQGASEVDNASAKNCWFKVFPVAQGQLCNQSVLQSEMQMFTLGLTNSSQTFYVCPSGNWGGICSKETTLRNGRTSTLNTGLVTIQNYGRFLPRPHVQLTLAHELGHSLGSPVSRRHQLYKTLTTSVW